VVDFEIEGEVDRNKKLKVFFVKSDEGLEVKGTSDNGKTYFLLRLRTDGTIVKYNSIPNDIGLRVDECGRLFVYGDE
jgi:hypothetical protein